MMREYFANPIGMKPRVNAPVQPVMPVKKGIAEACEGFQLLLGHVANLHRAAHFNGQAAFGAVEHNQTARLPPMDFVARAQTHGQAKRTAPIPDGHAMMLAMDGRLALSLNGFHGSFRQRFV